MHDRVTDVITNYTSHYNCKFFYISNECNERILYLQLYTN